MWAAGAWRTQGGGAGREWGALEHYLLAKVTHVTEPASPDAVQPLGVVIRLPGVDGVEPSAPTDVVAWSTRSSLATALDDRGCVRNDVVETCGSWRCGGASA